MLTEYFQLLQRKMRMLDKAVSVKQLNLYVKSLLESDMRLASISVCGEISNFKNHYSSGHLYFVLKDNDAAIRCVMFRSSAAKLSFVPQDGMAVIIKGRVSVYEKDGQYQFYAEQMLPAGQGDLALEFNRIKQKLQDEGLFNQENKRPLVKFPKRIAVITSDTGAAVRDILNILSNRFPICQVVLCPVNVQGEFAVGDMLDALERVYALDNVDTVIIGRGGGSAEDLNAFNSEELARKIYESPIPVISAVGHETDFTICDFVSDVRASTPSHAAELATPDILEVKNRIVSLSEKMGSIINSRINVASLKLDALLAKRVLSSPISFFEEKGQKIDLLRDSLNAQIVNNLERFENRLSVILANLDTLSPIKTLLRGFSVVTKQNETIKSVTNIARDDKISITFADGMAECLVTDTSEGKQYE